MLLCASAESLAAEIALVGVFEGIVAGALASGDFLA
jgi:hypothetical protein